MNPGAISSPGSGEVPGVPTEVGEDTNKHEGIRVPQETQPRDVQPLPEVKTEPMPVTTQTMAPVVSSAPVVKENIKPVHESDIREGPVDLADAESLQDMINNQQGS